MTITVDGEVDSSLSQSVDPGSGSVTLSFEGTGKKTVVVELDGQVYREYTIDFTTGSITNTVAHDYVPETEPPTEPPTEPQTDVPPVTQATETPEQPTADPNQVMPY